LGLLTASTKKIEFQKSNMADGRHFENRKIVISLTDFDLIWHCDACWSSAPDVKFIFFNFQQSYMADRRWLRIKKTA